MDPIMSHKPLVSVVMPVYNGEAYLKAAIESVLNQSLADLELVMINDGSKDESAHIAHSYLDPRIRVIHNETNRGVIYSRNRGLAEARSSMVALLDCDDIALPDRLALQYDYLEDNPSLMMVGGHAELIDEAGRPTGAYYKMPVGSAKIHVELLFRNVFVNSTIMYRKKAVQRIGGYRGGGYGEDYDLAFRLAEQYPVDNLDKVLVQYRVHQHNISHQADLMKKGEEELINYFHRRLGIPRSDLLQKTHLSFIRSLPDSQPDINDYYYLLSAIKEANDQTVIFPRETLDRELFTRWYELIRQSRSREALSLFFRKPIFQSRYASFKMYRKMIKQSLGVL